MTDYHIGGQKVTWLILITEISGDYRDFPFTTCIISCGWLMATGFLFQTDECLDKKSRSTVLNISDCSMGTACREFGITTISAPGILDT